MTVKKTIKSKLTTAFTILCAIILLQSAVSYGILTLIRGKQDELNAANEQVISSEKVITAHHSFFNNVFSSYTLGTEYTGNLDPEKCAFGTWKAQPEIINGNDAQLNELINAANAPHKLLHEEAARFLDQPMESHNSEDFVNILHAHLNESITLLSNIAVHEAEVSDVISKDIDNLSSLSAGSGILLAVLALVIAIIIIRSLTKSLIPPILQISAIAKEFAEGDISSEINIISNDEIAILADSFKKLQESIIIQAETLSKISDGDLKTTISVRSNKDVINQAINRILDKNNEVMSNINHTSQRVTDGSTAIANGAQNLANGSTEQAASIEEFSATIANVQAQAIESDDLAKKTLQGTQASNKLMQESMEYMQQLNESMQEIDTSSQNIAKVIKVIDDIAFQTNILALNAAVEAARAGEAGKGFAVVADEVRSLASKSATAAKETSVLIQNSVDRVKQGTNVAEKTNISLNEVIQISSDNAEHMQHMSESSKQQSLAISEINEGLAQISSVVQANSATAEESAAASQEISAQAESLQHLIAYFHLRDSLNETPNLLNGHISSPEPTAHIASNLPEYQFESGENF